MTLYNHSLTKNDFEKLKSMDLIIYREKDKELYLIVSRVNHEKNEIFGYMASPIILRVGLEEVIEKQDVA